VCPECAVPVKRSRQRSMMLRSADLQWLAGVRQGLRSLDLAMMVLFVAVIAVVLLAILIVGLRLNMPGVMTSGGVDDVLLLALGAVVAVLHVRGCLLIGMPTHADYMPRPWVVWALRVCGTALPLSAGATILLGSWLAGLPLLVMLGLFVLFQASALAFLFALAAVLEHLERRTRWWDAGLAGRHAGIRRNLYILAGLVVLIYWLPVVWPWLMLPLRVDDWGLLLFGLSYLLFSSTVGRVRRAVEMEETIAREMQGGQDASQ
jgi:hypothetical protein